MLTRLMWDATSINASVIPPSAELVAGYVTGTPDIKWTTGAWAAWPGKRHVTIDQGGHGTPVRWADVRDVETGAWTPESAVNGPSPWNVERPTIYCNRGTLPRVLAAGWRGDLWLAIPSSLPPAQPPKVANCTVVAVQYKFAGTYDRSIVFDPYWPRKDPGMTGIMYGAPNNLQQTATISVSWTEVGPMDGRSPAGYTISVIGLDDKEYAHAVTENTFIDISGLTRGWTYNVHVWANGGEVAPPHASIIVHT